MITDELSVPDIHNTGPIHLFSQKFMKARELCHDIHQFESNKFKTSGPLDMANSTLEKTEIVNENMELKRIIKELI